MPDQNSSVTLFPDGVRVVAPMGNAEPDADLLLEIQGGVRCAYNDTRYDALYVCHASGAADTSQPHAYLAWQPHAPILEASDIRAHRYLFRFPKIARGVSPTVRVDVDRFVNEFLIPPSEVRDSLSGQFTLIVHAPMLAAPQRWRSALAAVPALALTGGLVWVIHRRMSAGSLEFDLQAQLNRVREKAAAARRAIRPEDARLVPVRERLQMLEFGAVQLANQIQQIRGARALHNRAALERDAKLLVQRTSVDPPNEELLETLVVKRKALERLTELDRAESRLGSRLTRIEAVLESTLAGLQSVRVGAMTSPVGDSVCQALDAEVSALREATPQNSIVTQSRKDTKGIQERITRHL